MGRALERHKSLGTSTVSRPATTKAEEPWSMRPQSITEEPAVISETTDEELFLTNNSEQFSTLNSQQFTTASSGVFKNSVKNRRWKNAMNRIGSSRKFQVTEEKNTSGKTVLKRGMTHSSNV